MRRSRIVVWGDHIHPMFLEALDALIENEEVPVELVGVVTSPLDKNRKGWSRPILSWKDFVRRVFRRLVSRFFGRTVTSRSGWLDMKEKLLAGGITILSPTQEEIRKDKALENQFRALNADIFLFVAYTEYVPKFIFDIASISINIHPSLLPNYRGSHPIFWALCNGDQEIGITAFKMDEELDAGDICISRKIKVIESKYKDSIYDLIPGETQSIINDVLVRVNNGDLHYTSQPKGDIKRYYSPSESNYEVDWNVWKVSRFYWMDKTSSGALWTKIKGHKVFFKNVKPLQEECIGVQGEILSIDDGGVKIKCKLGAVLVENIESGLLFSTKAKKVIDCLGIRVGDLIV